LKQALSFLSMKVDELDEEFSELRTVLPRRLVEDYFLHIPMTFADDLHKRY